MFQPFTGQSAGDFVQIDREFNARGNAVAQKSFLDSVDDLENLLEGGDSNPHKTWLDRQRAASQWLNHPRFDAHRPWLLKAWLRATFRKWGKVGCDPSWENAIQAFSQGVENAPTADTVRALFQRRRDSEFGSYRILFPMAGETRGSLAWANVRVILRLDNEPALSVAPWSFYEWTSNYEQHLREVLPLALQASGLPAEEVNRWHFLLELSPVRATAADSPWDLTTVTNLKELEPNSLEIEGNSLELSVAIAAWAAHSSKSVSPLVATGQLESNGNIGKVGGIPAKAKAIQALQNCVPHLRVMFPYVNRIEVSQVLPLQGNPPSNIYYPASLHDLFRQPGLLTDGFDEYRAACGFESALPAEKTWASQEAEETELPLRENWLTQAGWYKDATSCEPEVVVMPFDESPETAALWLAKQAMRSLLQEKPGDQSQFPVAMAVSMDELFKSDWSHVLAGCAERTIKKATPTNRTAAKTDPEAVAIALRKPGKLVLVVYDAPSVSLWNRLGADEQFQVYQDRIGKLKSLAQQVMSEDGRGTKWAPQHIMAVCSDFRHALLWGHEFSESRPLASPKS